MKILGVNAFGHNPSACLVQEGRLDAFCQEDRFTRLKGSYGFFPSHAVTWCLRSRGLSIADIDRIAFSWGCEKYPLRMAWTLGRSGIAQIAGARGRASDGSPRSSSVCAAVEYLNTYVPNRVRQRIHDDLRLAGHKGTIPPVIFTDHHISHAYQTFYQSSFESSAILVADGSGEENCVSAFVMEGGVLRKLFGYDVPQSLGWFYAAIASYLGFLPNRDEGKVMGLAALGEERKERNPWCERLDRILRVDSGGFALDPSYIRFGSHSHHPRFTDRLATFITSFNPDLVPVGYGEMARWESRQINRYLLPEYIDLAFAAQSRLEDAVNALVTRLLSQSRMTNLCLAGGIFMNCKVNGSVRERHPGTKIFVHPAAGDDGACIGAAFHAARIHGDDPRNRLTTVQLGPGYTNAEIERTLQIARLSYTTPANLHQTVAELVARGKFVGWFQGGVEMGARALGGRSIIANPAQQNVKETINAQVKFREPWRPFCPSMIDEGVTRYLPGADAPEFMIVACQATEELRQYAPAVVHVDNTVRPQVVRHAVLPRWHDMLAAVGNLTGHPVVLNTSLNIRGEPMVCTPMDAVRCFGSTGLDALAIGGFLVAK